MTYLSQMAAVEHLRLLQGSPGLVSIRRFRLPKTLASLAAGLAMALAGCGAPATKQASEEGGSVINAGGSYYGATTSFDVSSGTVVADWRVLPPVQGKVIQATIEAVRPSGAFESVMSTEKPVTPSQNTGTMSFAVIPGKYRLRIYCEGNWNVTVRLQK